MRIKLSFLGAAQSVTGSRFLVEANGLRFLVDCGLYQERQFLSRNWDKFPVPPANLDAILLTHAHLDHCGWLPRLVSDGFSGPVYCTDATADIASIILRDSAKLQEQDAEYKRRRHQKEKRTPPRPVAPLYTIADAETAIPLFTPTRYGETVRIGEGVEATFHDAGHVLGSSMIRVSIRQDGEERIILFSGDVGRRNKPILEDPTFFEEADYVLVESTYGDRVFDGPTSMADEFAAVVNSTVARGGNVVIPSFALERSQELMYCLNQLRMENRIPHLKVFVDSPMAVNITDVFERHPELFDEDMLKLLRQKKSPFDFPGLNLVRTVDESRAISKVSGSAIIIAGSGMCTGGRIKYHLADNISRPESTVLFVGYQAIGTLGRRIVEGAREARILGRFFPVRAEIAQLHGFSGHADRDDLLAWLTTLRKPPRRVFVIHGEEESAKRFAAFAGEGTGWPIDVPAYGAEAILD